MKISQKIQEYASFVITAVVVIILAMMMFVIINWSSNWRDTQLWINAAFNTMLQIIMIATWLPEGKKRGEQDQAYVANKQTANTKMQVAAKAENFERLTHYCEKMTEQNRTAWITKRVARYGVVYAQWGNEQYRAEFDSKVVAKVRKAELAAPNRVPEIKATEIITNSEINLMYDTKDHTDSVTQLKVIFKIITSIVLCTVGAFINPEGASFAIESIVNFLYWLLIMSLSIFYSIRTGHKLITVERNDYYKRMIVFLNNFEVWEGDDQNKKSVQIFDENVPTNVQS